MTRKNETSLLALENDREQNTLKSESIGKQCSSISPGFPEQTSMQMLMKQSSFLQINPNKWVQKERQNQNITIL